MVRVHIVIEIDYDNNRVWQKYMIGINHFVLLTLQNYTANSSIRAFPQVKRYVQRIYNYFSLQSKSNNFTSIFLMCCSRSSISCPSSQHSWVCCCWWTTALSSDEERELLCRDRFMTPLSLWDIYGDKEGYNGGKMEVQNDIPLYKGRLQFWDFWIKWDW